MITEVVGDSFINTNVTMDKQHEEALMLEATGLILDHGIDAAFAILPSYRSRFVCMALDRFSDGVDALGACQRRDWDYLERMMRKAEELRDDEEFERKWLAAEADETEDDEEFERKWLAAEAEADALAAAQKEEKNRLAIPPPGSPDPESGKCKRKAEYQLHPETAKRMQRGGCSKCCWQGDGCSKAWHPRHLNEASANTQVSESASIGFHI